MKFDIKNLKLENAGIKKIEWAAREMPVLRAVALDFEKRKALKNIRIACCLHVTAETANLVIALKKAGAKVTLCASNPLSTQDDVAAALVAKYKIPVFAKRGESPKIYLNHLQTVLATKPRFVIDDGADLIGLLHKDEKFTKNIWGVSEETTTGVNRLKSLAQKRLLKFPVVAVNDSKLKFMFDNRYGTGQSTIDGLMRATNILLAGRKVVVAGYGWVGKGIAARARGMGALVLVTEVDPVKALEARMDGFRVANMEEAAPLGEIFITVTGNKNVITGKHFKLMNDGVILANAGHFNVEIDVEELSRLAKKIENVRPNLDAYHLTKNKILYLIARGRLVNLVAAEGHPAQVMDLSFSLQAKAVEFIINNRRKLKKQLYELPYSAQKEIAFAKLKAMGGTIDQLTEEQKNYLQSWEADT